MSKVFPYGLYKLENVIAVVLAGMVFFTAYEIAREAIFTPARQATVDLWQNANVIHRCRASLLVKLVIR